VSGLQRIRESWLLPTFMHGLILVAALVTGQFLLNFYQEGFLLYNPPIGVALFLLVWLVVFPLLLGALDVVFLARFFSLSGCQTGSWIVGLFLLLCFGSVNVVLETVWGITFSASVGVVEVVLLALPFGLLGRVTRAGFGKSQKEEKKN
jgi:hypothetical protein